VLDINSKMIRRSCVREQAYNPVKIPLSLCVFREGAKGSFSRVSRTFNNCGSREGFLFISLAEVFKNCFLGRTPEQAIF